MKIELELKSNGIHKSIFTTISEAESEDVEFIAKILKLVDEYKEEAIRNA